MKRQVARALIAGQIAMLIGSMLALEWFRLDHITA